MKTKSILIVDDDPKIRKTLSGILKAKGYATIAAATGKAALDKVQEEKPLVALIDLKLEDMPGLEVMEKIKEHSPGTECIVLTGYASQASAIEAINLGAYSYMQKPYDMEQLLVTIRRAVEKQETEEALWEALSRFEAVIENTPMVAIQGFDREGVIRHWNTACEHLYGFTAAEVIGQRLQDILLSGEDVQEFEQILQDIWRTGQAIAPREWVVRTRTGEERWVYSTMFPIFEHGAVSEVFCMDVDITERKRAEEERERRTRELAMLNEIGQMITSSLDLNEVLALLLEQTRRVLDAEACSVALLDEDGDLVFHHAEGEIAEAVIGLRLKPGQGIAGWVAQNGQPTLVPDAYADPHFYGEVDSGFTTRDVVCVPLIVRDKIIGVLELINKRQGTFTEDDMRILESVATQAATAIENARLHQETRRRLAREERLNELAHTLGGEMELATLIPRLLPPVVELTGADAGTVAILDPDREVITYPYNYNLPDALAGVEVPAESGLAGHTMQVCRPVLLDDYRQHPDALPSWVEAGVRSMLAVPLLVGDEVVGAMGLFSLEEVRPFGAEAVAAAEAAGRLAAVAIQRVRLFEAEQKRRQEAETLREAALALTATLDRDEVIERILVQLQEVVPYDSTSVQLLKGNQLEIVGGRGFPNLPDLLGTSFPIDGDNPNREVVRTRAPFIVENAQAVYEGFRQDPHLQAAIRSWLGVPMLVGDRLIGMIALDKREPGFYTQEHARLALSFAAQAAIAIENARLFQESQRRAEEMAALRQVNLATLSTLERDRVFEIMLDQLGTVVDYDTAAIQVITPDGRQKMIAGRGSIIHDQSMWDGFDVKGNKLVQEMRETRQPVVVHDTHTDERYEKIGNWEAFHSWVGAPLFVKDDLIGYLAVEKTSPGFYDETTIQLLGDFAQAAAIALENARLYEDIRRERDYSQTLIATANALIVGLDLDGRITLFNNFCTEITGYSQEEVLGRDWFTTLVPERERLPMKQIFQKLVEQGLPKEYESPILTKDGRERVIAWSHTVIGDAEGRPVSVLAIGQDITEHKQLETQLRRAQKMEALGQLAGGIAHDFNNLLTTIGGFAELLLRKAPEGSRQYEDLRQIKIAAQRAADLTRQLRLFTRQEEGERRPVQLNSVVEETRDLLARSLPKEITIKLRLDSELWAVEADPSQLSQVLMNLCVNARDAMPNGGILTLETRNVTLDEEYARTVLEARPGRYVCLSVSDTGCGMSPEVQARLFEPFFTTKERGKGTGLGLAVVYGIVKGHGGFINVYSEEGRGSTFHIYLPAIALTAKEKEVEMLELPAGTETILLVDDEEAVRELGQRVLGRCGYTVLTAENGVQALEVYQAHQKEIALVVLDAVMPQMGGRECLRRLQELDPQVKVLISTGYTADDSAQKLIAEGALGVVEKPFQLQDFAIAVRAALDK